MKVARRFRRCFKTSETDQNRATRGATILLGWPGRNTSGSRSDKRSEVSLPLRQRVWHRTGAGSWDLLFLRNLEAVASRPPHVTQTFLLSRVLRQFLHRLDLGVRTKMRSSHSGRRGTRYSYFSGANEIIHFFERSCLAKYGAADRSPHTMFTAWDPVV